MDIEQLIIFITIGSVVAMIALGGVGIGVTMVVRPRLLLRRRMAQIGVIGGQNVSDRFDSRRQRRIQDQVKKLEKKKSKRGWMDRVSDEIIQAGLSIAPNAYFIICVCTGVILTLFYLVAGMPPLGAIAAFLIGVFGLPRFILKTMAKKRQKKFIAHFADALDLIVRGVKSGLPVNECFNVIAREFEAPLGEEFRLIVEGQNLGLTLEELMDRGLKRLPVNEYSFFAIVMQIQRQTGGNLADTLAGLSSVLRQRKQLRDKIQAMASEAKASAGIIGSLPFFVTFVLSIMNPAYLMLLITERAGNILLGVGAFWLFLGVSVMRKMINFKI